MIHPKARSRLRSAMAAAGVAALLGLAASPAPLVAQEGAAAVQDVTVTDVVLPLGGTLLRAPKLTASGTRLSKGDLETILRPDSAIPWNERLARLDAGKPDGSGPHLGECRAGGEPPDGHLSRRRRPGRPGRPRRRADGGGGDRQRRLRAEPRLGHLRCGAGDGSRPGRAQPPLHRPGRRQGAGPAGLRHRPGLGRHLRGRARNHGEDRAPQRARSRRPAGAGRLERRLRHRGGGSAGRGRPPGLRGGGGRPDRGERAGKPRDAGPQRERHRSQGPAAVRDRAGRLRIGGSGSRHDPGQSDAVAGRSAYAYRPARPGRDVARPHGGGPPGDRRGARGGGRPVRCRAAPPCAEARQPHPERPVDRPPAGGRPREGGAPGESGPDPRPRSHRRTAGRRQGGGRQGRGRQGARTPGGRTSRPPIRSPSRSHRDRHAGSPCARRLWPSVRRATAFRARPASASRA